MSCERYRRHSEAAVPAPFPATALPAPAQPDNPPRRTATLWSAVTLEAQSAASVAQVFFQRDIARHNSRVAIPRQLRRDIGVLLCAQTRVARVVWLVGVLACCPKSEVKMYSRLGLPVGVLMGSTSSCNKYYSTKTLIDRARRTSSMMSRLPAR
jgi:hypothetical protein